MKSFALIVFVAIIAFSWADGHKCTQGQSKPHQDGCNSCVCTGGNWACTQMACIPRHKRDVGECTDGETKMMDCNTCRCLNKRFACTKMACPPKPRQKRASTIDDCVPGERFNDKCNSCICGPDGRSASCTFMACN